MSNLQDMFDEENVRKFSRKNLGMIRSEETRAKMGASKKNIPKSPEHCIKLSAAAQCRKHTAETLAKMSATRTGKPHSAEHCAKIKQAKIAKQSFTLIAEPAVYKGTGKTGTIVIEPGIYYGTQRMIADELNISVMTLQRRIARGWYKIKEAA